jgi:hypothetical protein
MFCPKTSYSNLLGWRLTANLLAADPDLKTRLAATSSLPHGAGLAAKFPRDAGLKADPQMIFADNFEAGRLGEGWADSG